LVLAWPGPGAVLRDDFLPQATGAGAALLLTFPAAGLLVLRKAVPQVRGLILYLVPLLVGVAWFSFGHVADTFEQSRVLLTAFTGLVLLLAGASLGERGRNVLARGALVVALALLVPAHFDRANGWTGVLGNTGSLSEAALPGALIGACLLARGSLPWRSLGAGALALEVAYTARVPVVAGALVLAAVLATTALAARTLAPAWRAIQAGIAGLALIALLLAVRHAPSSVPGVPVPGASVPEVAVPAAPAAESVGPGNTGGFEVRARIWGASLRLLGDHALRGVGPGQFAAAFPGYRDPREIELTTLGRRVPGETEVEHPHNDWLAPALDTGLAGGLCWIAFLITVVACSLRILRGEDPARLPLAAAALGLCANAFVNATLTSDAVSSTLAFALFGCVLGRAAAPRAAFAPRFVVFTAAVLLAIQAPRAWAFVRHGRALHPLASATPLDSDAQDRVLDTALEACPDSVLALRLRARLMESERRDPAAIHAAWSAVLNARPEQIEALMQLGLLAAVSGEPGQARPYYRTALDLDPGHPGVLQNLAVLELEDGQVDAGLGYLDRLASVHAPAAQWVADLAARLYLEGREHESDAVMERVDRGIAQLRPEEAYARSKVERRNQRTLLADALDSRAQRTWAREHMRAERFKDAVRIYRQDLRITRDYVQGGALRPRLELVAALLAAGRDDEARAEAAGLHPKASDWAALPDFAAGRLRATGWFEK
jgi:O-antigen ligase/tetratricopeptide (TPR) repeat protein